jgi:hypothetical protein
MTQQGSLFHQLKRGIPSSDGKWFCEGLPTGLTPRLQAPGGVIGADNMFCQYKLLYSKTTAVCHCGSTLRPSSFDALKSRNMAGSTIDLFPIDPLIFPFQPNHNENISLNVIPLSDVQACGYFDWLSERIDFLSDGDISLNATPQTRAEPYVRTGTIQGSRSSVPPSLTQQPSHPLVTETSAIRETVDISAITATTILSQEERYFIESSLESTSLSHVLQITNQQASFSNEQMGCFLKVFDLTDNLETHKETLIKEIQRIFPDTQQLK